MITIALMMRTPESKVGKRPYSGKGYCSMCCNSNKHSNDNIGNNDSTAVSTESLDISKLAGGQNRETVCIYIYIYI